MIVKPIATRWRALYTPRGLISPRAIRETARRIVQSCKPERIVLFGSYAYGKPRADSDVDMLVVMPARNEIDQATRIWRAVDPPFALDVIVRTPRNLAWRLKEADWFLGEVVGRGKVLYEKAHRRMVGQGRSGSRRRRQDRQG